MGSRSKSVVVIVLLSVAAFLALRGTGVAADRPRPSAESIRAALNELLAEQKDSCERDDFLPPKPLVDSRCANGGKRATDIPLWEVDRQVESTRIPGLRVSLMCVIRAQCDSDTSWKPSVVVTGLAFPTAGALTKPDRRALDLYLLDSEVGGRSALAAECSRLYRPTAREVRAECHDGAGRYFHPGPVQFIGPASGELLSFDCQGNIRCGVNPDIATTFSVTLLQDGKTAK